MKHPATAPLCAVILAGGRGTRMGGMDKAMLPFGDMRMVDHVAARIGQQVAHLAINANGDPARFAPLDLPVLPDPLPDHPGPLAGIIAGMDWAAALGASHVISVAVDTPYFPVDLVARLSTAGFALAQSSDDGRMHPTFGNWPVALRDSLFAALQRGERKMGLWAQQAGASPLPFPQAQAFHNINTPNDIPATRPA